MPDLDFSGIKPAKTVYLVHGAAHVPYQSGKDTLREREFFWCGPQARAGSGVVTHYIDPYYDGVGRTASRRSSSSGIRSSSHRETSRPS